MCGEYGDKLKRPHYHALLFGQTFNDQTNMGRTNTSKELEKLWGKGYTTIDQVTFNSAAYVARYTVKKVYGNNTDAHYTRLDADTGELIVVRPEFAQMSRNPGIGATFYAKYWPEIFQARDGVVLPGGKQQSAPRYYNKILKETNQLLKEEKDQERYEKSNQWIKDNTEQRLKVRELIAKENLKRKTRTLE